MKKTIILATMLMAVVSVKAASVDWKVSGTSSQTGYTVYLLTAEPTSGSYKTIAELAAAAVASEEIKSQGRNNYNANGTATDSAITAASMKNAYVAIVTSSTAEGYTYLERDMSANVYDTAKQESSPGFFTLSTTDVLAGTAATFDSGSGSDPTPVPEPTSGLLLVVGGALLALKRKRA